ncbi:MAG: hypothetical protein ACSLE1_17245 [Sphingobium sp.]
MTRKKTNASKRPAAKALVQVTDPAQALAVINQTGAAPAKIGTTTHTVLMTEASVVMATSVIYNTRDLTISDAEVFFRKKGKFASEGPWLGEADKVPWRDTDSGYECIMLREPDGGYLGGYVGVPKSHPLYSFDHRAVPVDLGIAVHGGLSYSKACDDGPSPERSFILVESRRICHPRDVHYQPIRQAGDYRVNDPHAWWFGFECNHLYDLLPDRRYSHREFLSAETAAIYRDDAYVIREITNLAAQLKAIADNQPIPKRKGPPLPPIGLEPDQGA